MMEILELLATTADGVYVVNTEHRIIYWNQAAQNLLGYEPEEVLGRYCYEVIAGRDRGGNLVCHGNCMEMAAARKGETLPSHDFLTKAKDGRLLWINVTNFFVPAANGDLTTVVHVFRDVTVQREKEDLVTQILSALKRLASLEGPEGGTAALPHTLTQQLTRREAEVLALLCAGAPAKAIAERLFISLPTARKHIQSILTKLGVHSRLEAVAYVSKNRPLGVGL